MCSVVSDGKYIPVVFERYMEIVQCTEACLTKVKLANRIRDPIVRKAVPLIDPGRILGGWVARPPIYIFGCEIYEDTAPSYTSFLKLLVLLIRFHCRKTRSLATRDYLQAAEAKCGNTRDIYKICTYHEAEAYVH